MYTCLKTEIYKILQNYEEFCQISKKKKYPTWNKFKNNECQGQNVCTFQPKVERCIEHC